MRRDQDTYNDGWDDAPGYYCYGTCDGCGLVVPEDIPDDAEGLIEQDFPDERLLCRTCCEAEAAAESLRDFGVAVPSQTFIREALAKRDRPEAV